MVGDPLVRCSLFPPTPWKESPRSPPIPAGRVVRMTRWVLRLLALIATFLRGRVSAATLPPPAHEWAICRSCATALADRVHRFQDASYCRTCREAAVDQASDSEDEWARSTARAKCMWERKGNGDCGARHNGMGEDLSEEWERNFHSV